MSSITDFANFQLGLLGWPLGHSLSPRLHQAALQACRLSGEYQLYPVQNAGQLKPYLMQVRCGKLDGLNVTIPYKQAVLPLLDDLTPTARAVGAVNTLYRSGSQVVGDNTDVPGFLADLQRIGPASGGAALVLGAGGAARAVVYALSRAGWQVTVAARRVEQAQALADNLRPFAGAVSALPLEKDALTFDFQLLVNATPVGMHPHTQANPWPEGAPLLANCFVYDLVYNPAQTMLLQQAPAGSNGLGMLIEQAALAFELWTGRNVPRQALWEAL